MEGLQEAGDLADLAVREASDDLTALTVLLEHARREGTRRRGRLYSTLCQGHLFLGNLMALFLSL